MGERGQRHWHTEGLEKATDRLTGRHAESQSETRILHRDTA